jgi:serine/arginine repetitive matrix protein 2
VVDPPQPEVLEAPLVQSSNHSVLESATQQSFQAEEVDASPKVAEEQVQPLETVSSADIPTSAHLPSTMPSKEPSVDARELLHDESLLMNTPEPSQHYDSRPPQISTPPIIEQVQAESEAPIIESDVPPLKKETSKQRRRREAEETMQREAEETMQREEQARLDQESFEQYRIDQERLEMARLEQKRLEREKARQERRRKEQIEQERFEKEQVEQERLEAERREREQLERERLEQDRLVREILEKEKLEKQRREKERLENERLEMERLEKERLEKEKLEKELLEQARMEQQRLEHQRLEREKIEQERLDQERLDAQRIQEEMNENKRLEQERIDNEVLEQQRLDKEAEADADRAELARKQILETEAARITKEHEVQIQEFAEKIAAEVNVEHPTSSSASSVLRQKAVLESPTAPTHRATPPPEARSRPPPASSAVRTSNPVSRLPTPAASAGRTSSPRSVASDSPRARTYASEAPPHTVPAHRPEDLHQMSNGRHASGSPALPAPRPQAVSQIIEENRPPAPSPPMARARPRHIPAFDSEDDSDSALVRPRRHFRGGEDYDGSSGAGQGYAQPAHHRSVFASRVPPAEPSVPSYSNPPPPQPPGYHPGYYPPTAPPHYQNHNYRVSQQGYPPPNPYGPSSHSSSSPYTEPWNYPQGYRHDSPPQRHDTLVTRDYPLGLAPIDTRSPLGDDPGDVFSRISQAIPDLHVLLARYKETHGQLSVREELLRRSAVEQEERLRVKDDEIADLKERNRSQEHRFSTEASRLRLQIGDLEEQARELQQQRAETDRFKREAYDTRNAFDAAMRSWETKYKELEEAHAAQARAAAEEKADLDAWKSSYTTRNDAEKIALAIHFDTRLKEADVLAENKRQEAATAFILEKDELRSDLLRKQQEQQAGFERVRNELETKLRAAQMDREESLRSEREGREVWLAEREALIKSHQDDRESILKGLDEQRDLLDAQYKNSRDEENARVAQLVMDMEELQRKYDALRTESEKEKAIIKSVASNLESEKSRLEKLMECYGDIAEIKSKGDTY